MKHYWLLYGWGILTGLMLARLGSAWRALTFLDGLALAAVVVVNLAVVTLYAVGRTQGPKGAGEA